MSRATVQPKATKTASAQAKLLLVDAERGSKKLASELGHRGDLGCQVIAARTITEAREIIAHEEISLLVTDLKLPDGDGLALLDDLRKTNPHASVVVTGRDASLDVALAAIRSGATDFVPKPFDREVLAQRVKTALVRRDALARGDRKIERLRGAVRKLSAARKTVAKKVDLLCNDLVSAYGEISRQLDSVRVGEDFRKLCDKANDLEQLLCHTMDWLMRRCGYANIAVFLATGETFQLGAYVKYTLASSPEMTEALLSGLLPRAGREGFVRMSADEATRELTAAELRHLRGQAVVAANCTYLGDSLATLVLFRDGATPFTNDDAETFRVIAPILAIALAGQTRGTSSDGEAEFGDELGEPGETGETGSSGSKEKLDAADWWKRGEAPPF